MAFGAGLLLGGPVRAEPIAAPPRAAAAPEAPSSEPALPAVIEVGKTMLVPVPGDRAAHVINAPANNRRAIVYLHGRCGNVNAVDTFKEAAVASGTVVSLLGDLPCGAGRFRWNNKLAPLQARVERALEAARLARGGLLDITRPVLFGYSQGAERAENLVAQYPERYQLVVLGGSPKMPKLHHLGATKAVAVFGGELETFGHMQAGAESLAAAGKTARFFLFPRAKHGEFGPDSNRVMGEIFAWLLADEAS
jgi:pimeloyl-ACP methyl ester carboxylesterase